MPAISFSGGPMHGKTVNVGRVESKFYFKGVLYYRKGKTRKYVPESTILKERKQADVMIRMDNYGKHTTVE